jgi:Glucodextranase, domain B/Carboxypeptidase regulatory-like domain/Transglutaminase-like superfamily
MPKRSLAFFFAVLSLFLAASAFGSVAVFGPKTYTVAARAHRTFDEQVPIGGPCDTARALYTLSVTNNGAKSGSISLNGAAIVDAKQLRKDAPPIEKTIAAAPDNTLHVELDGDAADGSISVSIRRRIAVPVFSDKVYQLTTKSGSFEQSFSVADTAGPFTLILRNGSASLRPVDDARVVLNGAAIVTKADIDSRGNQDTLQIIARGVTLAAQNTLRVELKSNKVPAGIALQIVREIADTTAPAIRLTGIIDGQTVTSSPVTLTGTVSDDSGVSAFTIDGAPVTLGSAGEFTKSIALVSGPNVIALAAADCEGNTRQEQLTITLAGGDTTPPLLDIAFPTATAANFYTTASGPRNATITGAVSDAQSGVQSVTCNGAPAEVEDGAWSCTIVLAPGVNPVTVEVADVAGNRSRVTRDITLFVDDVPPTIQAVLPPATAAGWRRGAVILSFDCRDDKAVAFCSPDAYLNDGAGQTFEGVAIDASGNETRITVVVNVDGALPRLAIAGSRDVLTKDAQFRLTGTVSDATSGVQSVRCGSVPATLSGEAFECLVPLTDGTQPVRVYATDVAGNEQSDEIAIKLDRTPPGIRLDAPETASLSTSESSILVAGSVTDDDRVASLTIGGTTVAPGAFAVDVPLTEGDNRIEIRATDRAGNVAVRAIAVRFLPRATLTITSPADLAVLRGNTVTVTGTIAGAAAAVRVNGVAATIGGAAFTAAGIPLWQGRTVITATAVTPGGQVATASVNVYRDSIPPRVTVYSPPAGSDVGVSPVIVSGMVDDIVVGTINAGQVVVTVNGVAATVSNRTFKASVTLTPGENTLIVAATDQGGNTTTTAHRIRFVAPAGARIVAVAGNDQTAAIGAELPSPLRVRLLDANGNRAAGQAVAFRVTANNGSLTGGGSSGRRVTVTTDAQGEAAVRWTLGTRAGAANQQVVATAAGFADADFVASGSTGAPALVAIDMGNNQFGINGERLPRPIVVAVVDRGSNRVADVPVTFSVLDGGGSIDGRPTTTVRTDSDGRAWITPTLGGGSGFDNHAFEATIAGIESRAVFTASSAPAGPVDETRISGVVLDNTSLPIAGVTLRVEGTSRQTRTDAQGQFTLGGVPAGYVRLIADGSTALRPGTWPTLEFTMYTNAGQDNTIGMPVFLLPIDVTRGVAVDEQRGGTITIPELPGFSLTIAPGSVTFPGGLRTGTISATAVHSDKMPMVPGFGQQPRFLITIQPPGALFDPPAQLTMPNVDGLGPGEVTEMYSFDHDLGQFVAIGTGSVSEDGSVVTSDPGVGIIKAGWHCGGNPAGSGTTGCVTVDVSVKDDVPTPPAPPAARRGRVASLARRIAAQQTVTAPKAALVNTCVLVTAVGRPQGSNGTPAVNGSYTWTIAGPGMFVDPPPPCMGQDECVAKVKSTTPGLVTVTARYTANGRTEKAEAKITFVKLAMEIDEVTFFNDILVITDQQGSITHNFGSVWKRTNKPEENDPIAYVGNFNGGSRKIKVKATFRIDPPAPEALENLVLKGAVSDPSQGPFPGGKLTKDVTIAKGAKTLVVDDFEADFKLPATTYYFNPMQFDWSLEPKNNCADDQSKVNAGRSANAVYVTLELPDVQVYRTPLHLAIAGPPLDSKQKAIDFAWSKFSTGTAPAGVKTWDGRPLVYYAANFAFRDTEQNNFETFLKTERDGGGRCGMHQELLYQTLRLNGIPARYVSVYPKSHGLKTCDVRRQFCATGFLVKNWSFGASKQLTQQNLGGGYEWLWETPQCPISGITDRDTPGECLFENAPPPLTGFYGDVQALAGAAGQHSTTPAQKAFPDHAIVRVLDSKQADVAAPIFTKQYSVSAASPLSVLEQVMVDRARGPFVLEVTAGDENGSKRVSGIGIAFNGTQVLTTSDLGGTVADEQLSASTPVTPLQGQNTLSIDATSAGEGTIRVSIYGTTTATIGTYYDPSYGKQYGSEKDFEDLSIDGYVILLFFPGSANADQRSKAARPPGNGSGVIFQ